MTYKEIVSNAIEFLEKSKNELDDLRVAAEINENWDLAEQFVEDINEVQAVIDRLSDEYEVEVLDKYKVL